MAAKKRTYNPRRIRAMRAYAFAELAEIYGVHVRTVQAWRKEGLEVLDQTSKPYLVMGYAVQAFLKRRQGRHKARCSLLDWRLG